MDQPPDKIRRMTRSAYNRCLHHLLHHPSCLAVEIPQLAVLRYDLGSIDLVLRIRDHRVPPLHLVALVQMY